MWKDIEGFNAARLLFYDTAKFPFAELLAKTVFKVPKLEKLHDAEITHRPEQIIVWLPFTDTFASNALWL